MHAIRQGTHQLVEHPRGDGTVALQILDDLHPRKELLAALLQLADLLDPRIQRSDFLAHIVIACVLLLDCTIQVLITGEHQGCGADQHRPQRHQETLLALLAALLAPGK
ncbi:hypothetical protein D3C78_1716350 [compost metagenome]